MPDRTATSIAYGTSAITILGSAFSVNDIALIAGVVIALATFVVNWYFKRKWITDERSYKAALLAEIKNKSTISIVQEVIGVDKVDD